MYARCPNPPPRFGGLEGVGERPEERRAAAGGVTVAGLSLRRHAGHVYAPTGAGPRR